MFIKLKSVLKVLFGNSQEVWQRRVENAETSKVPEATRGNLQQNPLALVQHPRLSLRPVYSVLTQRSSAGSQSWETENLLSFATCKVLGLKCDQLFQLFLDSWRPEMRQTQGQLPTHSSYLLPQRISTFNHFTKLNITAASHRWG